MLVGLNGLTPGIDCGRLHRCKAKFTKCIVPIRFFQHQFQLNLDGCLWI